MANRDIIVIGTSMGGVDALPRLIAGLPADLRAAVLIVQHMAAREPNFLAELLDRSGPLPVRQAVDGEPLQLGRIYVPVPDHHLMLENNRIRLTHGPKESHARPSIDVLFRSAAYFGGPRVIGIILTGNLDDGTAGLWAIKDRGGIAMVQSPQEARYPSMPTSARKHVRVDYTLPLDDIPNVLRSLTREHIELGEAPINDKMAIETRIALGGKAVDEVRRLGKPSFYTCPDCHGSMVAIEEGNLKRFRCHTGHAFSEAALLDQSLTKIEETLWWALAQVEEREALLQETTNRTDVPPEGLTSTHTELTELQQLGRELRALASGSVFSRTGEAAEVEADLKAN